MNSRMEKHEANLLRQTPIGRLKWQEDGMRQQILSPCQLKFVLLGMTKNELDEVRRTISLRHASSLKKQELVEKLRVIIPQQATEVFARFDEERYQLAQNLIRSGGILYQPHISPAMAKYLRKNGLIFIGNHKGRKAIIMPEEVVAAFQQAEGPELARKVRRNSQWIRLTQGLLFYYGVLDFTQAKERLEHLTGERINVLEYGNVISAAARCYRQMEDTLSGVASRRVLNPDAIKKEQKARADIAYYPATKEQLLAAGQPDYTEQTPALQEFIHFLWENCHMPSTAAGEIAGTILNRIDEGCTVEELLDDLRGHLHLNSHPMAEALTEKLQELFNHTRRWALKGHTPAEIFRDEAELLQSRPGHSKQPETNLFDIRTGNKVRGNDSCLCGSGKTFKQCCGTRLHCRRSHR